MPKGKQIQTIQAIRAIAAVGVVFEHFSSELNLGWFKTTGEAGVALFFVLSGYIIPLSIKNDSPTQFLRRRAERIVPLYWICTTVKLLAALLLPFTQSIGSVTFVVLSYLMLPLKNGAGQFLPLLPTGWTLVFEAMFYYMVFVAIFMKSHRVWGVVFALTLSFWITYSNLDGAVMYICFVGGLFLVISERHFAKIPSIFGGMLALAGLSGVFYAGGGSIFVKAICSVAALAGAIAVESSIGDRIPSFIILIGDASYSLYLTHLLLVMPIKIILRKVHLSSVEEFSLCVLVSIAAAVTIHLLIERPLMELFRRRRYTTRAFQVLHP